MNARDLLLAPVAARVARGRGAVALVPAGGRDRRARARTSAARRPLQGRVLRRFRRGRGAARDRHTRVQPHRHPCRRGRVSRVAVPARAEDARRRLRVRVLRRGRTRARARRAGVDVSQYALDRAALGARGFVRYGNLLHRLPYGRRRVRGGVVVRDARAPPARGRPARVARGAPGRDQVRDRDDSFVRPERERSGGLVRRQGAARAARLLPRRSATATTARFPTTTCTATTTARRSRAI